MIPCASRLRGALIWFGLGLLALQPSDRIAGIMRFRIPGTVTPLGNYPLVLNILTDFGVYPLIGIMIGALLTAITNSSSASTSLVIAMSMEGIIPLNSGIALIIGANIGTCVLELIATVGMNTAARRTGMAQFIINIFGALLFYPFLEQFAGLISLTASDTPRLIANAHTVFNVTVSLIMMPFVGVLMSLLSHCTRRSRKSTGWLLLLPNY